MPRFSILLLVISSLFLANQSAFAQAPSRISVDLLVVGGSESACAAAVQAARLGVKSIALVNDIDWLGGQFTAEGLGAVDEWTIYKGQRAPFPRSGTFLEIMDRIEIDMQRKYGHARPGNSFCAWTTCEPRDTERIFRQWMAPYLKENGGPIQLFEYYEPRFVTLTDVKVSAVTFEAMRPDHSDLTVQARITIDASDWGDVIKLSGAEYFCGPDMHSKFNEPNAPKNADEVHPNEMNPLTWCLVLRETNQPQVVLRPEHYDDRTYYGATTATAAEYRQLGWPKGTMAPFAPAWVDSVMPKGPYGESPTVYTHRRLVDRRHLKLPRGTEAVLVNWPLQDYPTFDFPQHVVDELEAQSPGASKKNMVEMTPAQRRVVLADCKRHALGLLHHLQTTVHDKEPDKPVSFRNMKLTDEFGTPDKLPPKPYLREALRTDALYMLREQDLRDTDGVQSWANSMTPDNVFGFQFNIDFHPTRRIFFENHSGPWAHIHSKLRNWSTHTDRAGFPLRSLVPIRVGGLLAAGKSLGVTSIVSSAVRLHGHGMLAGQAAATVAAVALEDQLSTQQVARRGSTVRRVQKLLVSPALDERTNYQPPGVLLWPYQDLPPTTPHFAAANYLAVRGILPGEPGAQDFEPEKPVKRRDLARALYRAVLASGARKRLEIGKDQQPVFSDVPENDPDRVAIESLAAWKLLDTKQFDPDKPATAGALRSLAGQLGWKLPAEPGDSQPLTRASLAILLWSGIRELPDETFQTGNDFLAAGHDADGDGIADREDPLPLDRDNDNVPDALE